MQTITSTLEQNASGIENLCPVCGYEMEYPPGDYKICPSCGTEFGVNDVNSSTAELREAWLKTGPAWWSPVDALPERWNPKEQLRRMLSHQSKSPRLLRKHQSIVSVDVVLTRSANRRFELSIRGL
jgi:hypothetical protein